MKIQIDTDNKVIKIEGTYKVTDIMKVVKQLLPNDWKEYSLETNTIIYNWTSPIVINKNDWWNQRPYYVGDTYIGSSIDTSKVMLDSPPSIVNYEMQI